MSRRRDLWIVLTIALLLSSLGCGRASQELERGRPDIILVTIDTLRADALGFAGNEGVETPFLDALAAEGRVFTNAHAHNVVTLPSHANILTGLYPYQHGVRDNAGYELGTEHETIATMLRRDGYATGAFVAAFPLDARFGLDQGFDVYDDDYAEQASPHDFVIAERPATEVLQSATDWYRSVEGPKFMWVHLYDPHAPYEPPAEFAERYWDRKYLGEVAATDHALDRFLAPLLDGEDPPVVIVTSDHGESLGEHGELTHGLFAYQSTLAVPLVVWTPEIESGVDDRLARHVDLIPTILELAGIEPGDELPGRSLLGLSEDGVDSYFESLSAALNRGWAPLVGMIHDDHKYIDLPLPELYDLKADPREQSNLARQSRRTFFALRERLAAAAPTSDLERPEVQPEDASKLLSLGYLSGGGAELGREFTAEDDPKNLVDVDAKLHRVVHLYQMGQVERAVTLAQEVVDRRPDMAVGQEMLAFVLQQNEQIAEAVEVLEQAVMEGSASPAIRRRLGLMLSETGRAKEAVSILRPLANESAIDNEVLNALGIALADVGDMAGATECFSRVLGNDSRNAVAYQNLGVVALRQGHVEDARSYLQRALQIDGKLPVALTTLGVIHANEDEHGEALELWAKAVSIDDRQFDAWFNIGIVAMRSGRNDTARRALESFVRSAPPSRYARDIEAARSMLRKL